MIIGIVSSSKQTWRLGSHLHLASAFAPPIPHVLASRHNLGERIRARCRGAVHQYVPFFAKAFVMTNCDISTLFCSKSAMTCLT